MGIGAVTGEFERDEDGGRSEEYVSSARGDPTGRCSREILRRAVLSSVDHLMSDLHELAVWEGTCHQHAIERTHITDEHIFFSDNPILF